MSEFWRSVAEEPVSPPSSLERLEDGGWRLERRLTGHMEDVVDSENILTSLSEIVEHQNKAEASSRAITMPCSDATGSEITESEITGSDEGKTSYPILPERAKIIYGNIIALIKHLLKHPFFLNDHK